jgi:isopentenyl-diphosphate delta-isomerase
MNKVILVDENDNPTGEMEKLEAHQKAVLHRAFSIFIFNDKGELMLQKRADRKYHSGGLWTNTTCSHPAPGKETKNEAVNRLKEEMGFTTDLDKLFTFKYKKEFDNGLTEHEYDHVFIGHYDDNPNPNPDEVGDWRWISPKKLIEDINTNPEKYTFWFKQIAQKVLQEVADKS